MKAISYDGEEIIHEAYEREAAHSAKNYFMGPQDIIGREERGGVLGYPGQSSLLG